MDIRNLKTFIKAAELGTITGAARELNFAQSSASAQIQQLEKELGFPLFDRIGKRVSLTALGVRFLSRAYEITKSLEEAANLGKDISELGGTLRVGVLESLLFGKVLKILPDFKEKFKNLDLQLKMGQASELLSQLRHNRLDMVYISAGQNTDPELSCRYKRQENLIFVCGAGHTLAEKKQVSLSELFGFGFALTERTGICCGRLRELAEQSGAVLRGSIEVDSTIAIAELLKNDNTLAFLPEYSVQTQIDRGILKRVDVELEPQIYYSQILCHKNRWVSPFMQGFIDSISEEDPKEE